MFAPHDFFDLSNFSHKALFANISEVWEALKALPEYVCQAFGLAIEDLSLHKERVRELVQIAPGALVEEGAIIIGPALLGAGCRVTARSLLRGPVILGEGAYVGHSSEVKASVLLNGAQAPHLSYVGDSILGAKVNMGAGSVCANVKFSGASVQVRAEGSEFETGLKKFGAILGDGVKVGCNAVLIPGTIVGPRTWIYPGICVSGFIPADSVVRTDQKLRVVPKH